MLEAIHRALYGMYFELDVLRGRRVVSDLRRRHLDAYAKILARRPVGGLTPVPVVSGLKPEEVYRDWVLEQRPVVIKQGAAHWKAVEKWDFGYFDKHYGTEMVGIGRERIDRQPDGTSFEIETEGLNLSQFVRRVGAGEDIYLKFNPILERFPELYDDLDYEQLAAWTGNGIVEGATANEFYMGGAKTRTDLHTELSDIFHVCIAGRKRWVLYPAAEWPLLYPVPARTSFVASEANAIDLEFDTHPMARYARGWEAEIEPGDVLYLPCYTWHAVENPTPVISVNLLWHRHMRSMRALPLAYFNWRFLQDDEKGTAEQFLDYFRGTRLPSLHGGH